MPLFDVRFSLSIPGIPTSKLTRTVDAATVEEAIAKAKTDIVNIVLVSVNPNLTGLPVLPSVEPLL